MPEETQICSKFVEERNMNVNSLKLCGIIDGEVPECSLHIIFTFLLKPTGQENILSLFPFLYCLDTQYLYKLLNFSENPFTTCHLSLSLFVLCLSVCLFLSLFLCLPLSLSLSFYLSLPPPFLRIYRRFRSCFLEINN